jgi:hypothetical protein
MMDKIEIKNQENDKDKKNSNKKKWGPNYN